MLGFVNARVEIACLIIAVIGVGFATVREYVEEKMGERRARKIIKRYENVS